MPYSLRKIFLLRMRVVFFMVYRRQNICPNVSSPGVVAMTPAVVWLSAALCGRGVDHTHSSLVPSMPRPCPLWLRLVPHVVQSALTCLNWETHNVIPFSHSPQSLSPSSLPPSLLPLLLYNYSSYHNVM